ncbi:hypothetical protein DFJ73DRAFT_799871 [Zopfochytrium polystomum]|nr:hypothetical protein DFJ73DRAFT_799871 [Zopfochytrium polystomum]
MDRRVVLNVGGRRFETFVSTLQCLPDSLLGTMFSRRNSDLRKADGDGEFFFDRNASCFDAILDAYRIGKAICPPTVSERAFERECLFWGIEPAPVRRPKRRLPVNAGAGHPAFAIPAPASASASASFAPTTATSLHALVSRTLAVAKLMQLTTPRGRACEPVSVAIDVDGALLDVPQRRVAPTPSLRRFWEQLAALVAAAALEQRVASFQEEAVVERVVPPAAADQAAATDAAADADDEDGEDEDDGRTAVTPASPGMDETASAASPSLASPVALRAGKGPVVFEAGDATVGLGLTQLVGGGGGGSAGGFGPTTGHRVDDSDDDEADDDDDDLDESDPARAAARRRLTLFLQLLETHCRNAGAPGAVRLAIEPKTESLSVAAPAPADAEGHQPDAANTATIEFVTSWECVLSVASVPVQA